MKGISELLSIFSPILFGLYAVIDHKQMGIDSMNFQVKYFDMNREVANGYIKPSQYAFFFMGSYFILVGISTLLGDTKMNESTPVTGIPAQLDLLFNLAFTTFCLYKITKAIQRKL